MLFPVVLADARRAGSATVTAEAWGWLPPPLVDAGRKLKPAWLQQYLLNPTLVRPAAVLRMPRFNMSSEEATVLAEYFRASLSSPSGRGTDKLLPSPSGRGTDKLLPSPSGRGAGGEGRGAELAAGGSPYESGQADLHGKRRFARLDQAMRVLVDRQTFCAKCHYIGAYGPGGATRTTLAPDLENVADRLHPSYIRQWVARPNSILPYTGMPVNFPPEGEPLGQDLLPGTSLEQLDAVTELLAHFDEYLKAKIDPTTLAQPPEEESE